MWVVWRPKKILCMYINSTLISETGPSSWVLMLMLFPVEPNLDLRMISDWKPLLTDDFISFKSSRKSPFYHDIPTQNKKFAIARNTSHKTFRFFLENKHVTTLIWISCWLIGSWPPSCPIVQVSPRRQIHNPTSQSQNLSQLVELPGQHAEFSPVKRHSFRINPAVGKSGKKSSN